MIAAALVLVFVPAQTQALSCDEVRRVHGAAVTQGLDDGALRVLEQQACTAPSANADTAAQTGTGTSAAAPDHGQTRECVDLQVMSILAHTTGDVGDVEEIDGLKGAACSIGLSDMHINWKNGTTARTGNGSWNWPNGMVAKYQGGGWNWPNGTTARYDSGVWNWPDGSSARAENGSFESPHGVASTREQIIAPACAKDEARCQNVAKLSTIDPDLGMAALIQLGWESR